MNPPFGAASLAAKKEFEKAYPRTKNDIYAAFVERGIQLLHPGGMLGAITSRTGFFLSSFQKWREEILLRRRRRVVFADLGYGVMDAAMVEAAAYCLRSCAVLDEDVFLRLLDAEDKAPRFDGGGVEANAAHRWLDSESIPRAFRPSPQSPFRVLGAGWTSPPVRGP